MGRKNAPPIRVGTRGNVHFVDFVAKRILHHHHAKCHYHIEGWLQVCPRCSIVFLRQFHAATVRAVRVDWCLNCWIGAGCPQ
jgi:hypothetical protein